MNKIKFSIPTNWDDNLVDQIKVDCVEEIFGKLDSDPVGGGRASSTIRHVSQKKAREHIKKIHQKGVKFNYLLNAGCLNNFEWTIRGQRQLHGLLDWLLDCEIDSVTVSIPYLLEFIKKQYPKLQVNVSTQVGVDRIKKAMFWEDLGADKITLAVTDINRNFKLLTEIRKNIKCKMQLIANLECLYGCPFYEYHSVLNAHASQSGHSSKGFVLDYCYLRCSLIRLQEPKEFIRSGWIRPEDVHYYEDLGVDCIKLVNRGMPTEQILLVLNAYAGRSYDGNLLDLFSWPEKNTIYQNSCLVHKIRYFFRPFSINIFELLKARKIFSKQGVYIDNKKLDGSLEFFLKEDCALKSCRECGYCEQIAKKVIRIDAQLRDETLKKYQNFLDSMLLGKLFTYINDGRK